MVQPITDKVYLIKCLEMLYSYKSVLYPSLPFIYQISIFSGIVAVVFSSVVLHTCVDTADSRGLVGVEGVRQVSWTPCSDSEEGGHWEFTLSTFWPQVCFTNR